MTTSSLLRKLIAFKRFLRLPFDHTLGIFFALMTGLLTALMMAFVHNAKNQFSAADLLTFRSAFFIAFALPFSLRSIGLLVSRQSLLIWVRAALACGAIFVLFHASQEAPIGLVSSLFSATPLMVYLIARLTLNEALTVRHFMGCIIAGGGIVLLSTSSNELGISTTIAILCLVGILLRASSYVTLRAVSNQFPSTLIILLLSICTACFGLVMGANPNHITSNFLDINLLGVGITSALMQVLLTQTYKRLPAGKAALCLQSEVIWAVLISYLFHDYVFTIRELLAVLLIVGGTVWSQRLVTKTT